MCFPMSGVYVVGSLGQTHGILGPGVARTMGETHENDKRARHALARAALRPDPARVVPGRIDTTTGDPIEVVVTITGTSFTIEPVDTSVTLVDASWCVKSSTRTNDGTGTSGQSESFNKKGVRQDLRHRSGR